MNRKKCKSRVQFILIFMSFDETSQYGIKAMIHTIPTL